MRSGELFFRVTIQQCTETINTFGEPILTWGNMEPSAVAWCDIEPLSGRELFNAQQVQPDATHRVRMRYRPGVTTKMRLLEASSSRVFNVLSVLTKANRDTELELMCREAV